MWSDVEAACASGWAAPWKLHPAYSNYKSCIPPWRLESRESPVKMKHQIINQTKKKTCKLKHSPYEHCHHMEIKSSCGFINPYLGGWHTAGPPARAFPVSLLLPSSPLSSTKFRGLGWKKMEYLKKLFVKQSILPINLMNIERNAYKDPIFWYTMSLWYNRIDESLHNQSTRVEVIHFIILVTGGLYRIHKGYTINSHASWDSNLHMRACLQSHTECYRMQHLSRI